ncbi:MAG: hypothetical protein AAGF97_10305 [Planctomycetota bacterium]
MQAHPTGTDPTTDAMLVCRNTRIHLWVLLALVWAAPTFWWWASGPMWVGFLTGGFACLLTFPLVGSWRNAGRPENWVLAVHPHGLWVNLRDVTFCEAEPGDTVCYIPFAEIECAGLTKERYQVEDHDGITTYHCTYLDLQLPTTNARVLGVALQQDRQRKLPVHHYLGGAISVTIPQIKQQPVEVVGDDTLRIKFKANHYRLTPGLNRVLAALEGHVQIVPPAEAGREEWSEEHLIYRFIREGEDLQAIRQLRKQKRLSLSESKAYVSEARRQLADRLPQP